MEIRTILWGATAGVIIAAGMVHFVRREMPVAATPQFLVVSQKTAPAAVTVPMPAAAPADEELLQTATNDASAQFILDLERKWLADDPLDARARVSNLMLALCGAGKFSTALALANAAPAELRTNWLQLTFRRWAQRQPQDAIQSLDAVADPILRSTAFRAAADGWNQNDPGGLAAYAVALPDSDDRAYALTMALDNWSLQDPAALGAWLNTLPRGTEFDIGAAWMLSKSDGANRPPDVALEWVENISDPMLQAKVLNHVIGEWAQTDRKAVLEYVASASWLEEQRRAKILDSLSPR